MADFSLAEVFQEIEKQAKEMGVDPMMAKALAVAENTSSGSIAGKKTYSGSAVSPVGASGVMQVMPATARGLQQAGFLPPEWKHDPSNLSTQVQAGLAAIKEKMRRMNDPSDIGEMASVYNGSSKTHAAYKAGRMDLLPEETKQYAEKLRRATMELGGNAGAGRGTQGVAEAQALSTPGATTTRTSTSQRQALYDPVAQQTFLDDILNYTGAGGGVDQTVAQLQQAAANRGAAGEELLAAITAAGAAKGEEAASKAALQAGAASQRAVILAKMNLNPAKTGNEMDKAFDTITTTGDQISAMRADINNRQQTNIVTNPLQWLIDKSVLPGLVKKFNGTVDVQNDAIARYRDLASITGTQQSLSAATDADGILRAGKAAADSDAADAAAKAAGLKVELAGAEIRDMQTTKSLMGQKLDLQLKALQLSKVTETSSTSDSERVAAKKFEEQTFANIQNMIKAAGGNPPANITELKMLTPKKREALMQAATSGTFGENFSESFQFVWENGNRAKLATQGGAGVVTWIQGTAQEASKLVGVQAAEAEKFKKHFDGKKALPEVLNAMQSKYEAEGAKNMREASEFNPLRIEYKSASDAPELKNNAMAIWLKEYGPGGPKETMQKVDEGRVVQKFAQAVKDGSMTPAYAAGQISEYYKIATVKQAKATNYPMFGISKPSKTYVVQLPDLGASSSTVDLGDPVQVENALTRKIVADVTAARWAALKAGAVNPVAGVVMAGQNLMDNMGVKDPLANLFGNE